MMDIKQNTVSAENQTIRSSDLSFLGNENAPLKILIVGNSITRHGPKPEIGWPYDWGMAASAPEKDYVHLLYSKLQTSGREAHIMIRQASYWERHFRDADILDLFNDQHKFGADIVIFRLGENVPADAKSDFPKYLKEFINYICPKGSSVIFTSCFWKNADLDSAIHALATERNDKYVDICHTDDSMMALGLFEHSGVAMHPGDLGMKMIADRIYEAL